MAVYTEPDKQRSRLEPLASEEYVVKAMPPILGTFDMTAVLILIVFFISNANTAVGASSAAFTYLLIGGVAFFIPSLIATAQLGSMFPHEGSLYNWTHKAFGGYWSFFVAFCAWFPGILVMVSAADDVIAYLQGLNPGWLPEPWQQGVLMMAIILFSAYLATRRFRTVQNLVNVVACCIIAAVVILALASAMWLLKGHPSATNLGDKTSWLPNTGNIATFGLVILAYLGVDTPLNMGGEIVGRRVVTRHLLWGALIVLVGYLVASFSLLVVVGSATGNGVLSSFITVGDMGIGKVAGNLIAVLIIAFFLIAIVVYNYAYARLLLVAGIDQRLPASVGRLNRNRVPANAIVFQTVVAAILAGIIFIAAPFFFHFGKAADLTTMVYNVMLAASSLVWAVSAAFLFLNLVIFYIRDREAFHTQMIFPAFVIWISVVLGLASCVFAVGDSIFNSWIPGLIPNSTWWYIIGGLTLFCLIVAAIGSMFASSEADWQGLNK